MVNFPIRSTNSATCHSGLKCNIFQNDKKAKNGQKCPNFDLFSGRKTTYYRENPMFHDLKSIFNQFDNIWFGLLL